MLRLPELAAREIDGAQPLPYALLDTDGVVQRIVSIRDGDTEMVELLGAIYAPPPVEAGWRYDGSDFLPPPDPVET